MTNYPLYAVGTNTPGYLPDGDVVALHYDYTDADTLDAITGAVLDAIALVYASSVDALEFDRDTRPEPHEGHAVRTTGAWWCDTCNSPLCDRDEDSYVYPLSDGELSDAIDSDRAMVDAAESGALDDVAESVRRAVESGDGFGYYCTTNDDASGGTRTTVVFVQRCDTDGDTTCTEYADHDSCEFDCSDDAPAGALVYPSGVVEIVDAAAYTRRGADVATCGACGRSWDDSVVTGHTPAPSARCPFEYDHNGAVLDAVTGDVPDPDSYYDERYGFVLHRIRTDEGHAVRVYRVQVQRDDDAESPRMWSNVGALYVLGTVRQSDIDESGDMASIFAEPGKPSTFVDYADMWRHYTSEHGTGFAAEIIRLVAVGRGDVVGFVERSHDGTLSVDWTLDAWNTSRVHVGEPAPRSWSHYGDWTPVLDRVHGDYDGIVVVDAARVAAEFDTSYSRAAALDGTPVERARLCVESEFDVYNNWIDGDVYEYVVDVAVVTVDDVVENGGDYLVDADVVDAADAAEFDAVGSCGGFYGEFGPSGLNESVRAAISEDMTRRAEFTVSSR